MVERIRLQAGIFRISKPNIDVATANDAGLIFSESAGGLIPAVSMLLHRQSGINTVDVPLPEPGYVPLIFLRNATSPAYSAQRAESINSYVNQAKTVLTVFMPATMNTVRCVIFKNRQF